MDFTGLSDAILALWNGFIDGISGIAPWLQSIFTVEEWLAALTDWISAFPFF